ncbi:hypothetical protein D3C72_1230770 [compost metagenome]
MLQCAREAGRVERPPRAVDEAGNAVLLGFRRVLAAQLLHPAGSLLRTIEIEATGIQQLRKRHVAEAGQQQLRIAVQAAQHRQRVLQQFLFHLVHLADHDHVGKLHLLAQQVDHAAVIVRPRLLATLGQAQRRTEIGQEGTAVHHRHHRVQPCDIAQAEAVLITNREGGRHRHRLADPGRFDQQVVVAVAVGQAPHLLQEIVAQRAADAAVAELHQRLFGATQLRAAVANQLRIDVDLAHVVDDHRHPQAIAVAQDLVEQGGLAGPKEAGEHGDRKATVGAGNSVHVGAGWLRNGNVTV